MAQYLIGMYQPDGIVPPPEFLAPIMARLGELTQEMQKENVWVFAGGLHDASTATVLHRKDDGDLLITDGPYTEGKEHLGGFVVVDADSLDGAIAEAERLPGGVAVEIRPVVES